MTITYERNAEFIHGNDEFQHHGIKGMKWGIRRYQNYDGSYTQEGVRRYNTAMEKYENADKKYKEAKKAYKDNKITKEQYKAAKKERKTEKKEVSKAYDHVKMDKKADQGKELYSKSKTITDGQATNAKIASAGATIAGVGKAYNYMNPALLQNVNGKLVKPMRTSDVMIYAGLGLTAIATVHGAYKSSQAKKLRAYYGHKYYERGKK